MNAALETHKTLDYNSIVIAQIGALQKIMPIYTLHYPFSFVKYKNSKDYETGRKLFTQDLRAMITIVGQRHELLSNECLVKLSTICAKLLKHQIVQDVECEELLRDLVDSISIAFVWKGDAGEQ